MKTTRRALLTFLCSMPFLRKSKGNEQEWMRELNNQRVRDLEAYSGSSVSFTTGEHFELGQSVDIDLPGLKMRGEVCQILYRDGKDDKILVWEPPSK